MTSFLLTVVTKTDGWVELGYTAKTVAEAKDWAMGLDGVVEVAHIGVSKRVENLVNGDPVWCSLERKRVRFVRMVDAVTVEVSSNETGKILPDWRHISQLKAI